MIIVQRVFWLKKIHDLWEKRPIIWLSGVRRVGKTTLAKMIEGAKYLNCDLPSSEQILRDPEAFYSSCNKGDTLIFDEIDQGIGGRIGAVVGEKLYKLTEKHQVICITHLPQLAGFGQQHYQVVKDIHDGRSVIKVKEITGKDRIEELATMLGGPSEKNLASAKELIDYVSQIVR